MLTNNYYRIAYMIITYNTVQNNPTWPMPDTNERPTAQKVLITTHWWFSAVRFDYNGA